MTEQTMTGAEFKAGRERLGLSYRELGEILGGIRADTIRRKWELDAPSPSPIASQIMRWMLAGYRPPEWPLEADESGRDDLPTGWRATHCPCGHDGCRSWHVSPVAAIQGVSFTEAEARLAAASSDLARALREFLRTERRFAPEVEGAAHAALLKAGVAV